MPTLPSIVCEITYQSLTTVPYLQSHTYYRTILYIMTTSTPSSPTLEEYITSLAGRYREGNIKSRDYKSPETSRDHS